MAAHDEYNQINKEFIKILNDLLAAGNWEATLFLRTAQKKLQNLLDQANNLLTETNDVSTAPRDIHQMKLKQGYIKVYVSIYQSDPYNMVKWQNTLKSIKEHSINRPIYRSEEHIEEMIRSKQGSANEGYVIIFIKSTDIIPAYAGKQLEDRWGHELLTLRDNSLAPENIIEFVHQGRRFLYKEGKLLPK